MTSAEAFQPAFLQEPVIRTRPAGSHALFMRQDPSEEEDQPRCGVFSRARKAVSSKVKPIGLALLAATAVAATQLPQAAQAATPLPKQATLPDAEKKAMHSIKIEMEKKQLKETQEYNKRARAIEASDGSKAREAFEKEYKEEKTAREQEMMEELEALQRDLLDRGIDPFNDMEGYRQCFLVKTGRNLAEIEGTDQFADAQMAKMGMKKQTYAYQKAYNRAAIKMMVEDYKTRGIDPLPVFANKENHNRHAQVLYTPSSGAAKKVASMKENLVKYGQIDAPKAGEMSVNDYLAKDPEYTEKMAAKLAKATGASTGETDVKAEAKAKAAAEKAKIKAEKAKAREEAKAVKEKAKQEAKAKKKSEKEEKRLAKEVSKKEKEAAKVAAAAAATAATAATTTVMAASDIGSATADVASPRLGASEAPEIVASDKSASIGDFEDDSKFQEEYGGDVVESTTKQSSSLFTKVAGLTAIAVGGKFVIGRVSQPSAVDEAERQRQFKLLMGLSGEDGKDPDTAGAIDAETKNAVDAETEEVDAPKPKLEEAAETPATSEPAASSAPKKRGGLGIKSMFSKKNKNDRETDLNVLVSSEATAPNVASLLAKLLTFGAPGRFPAVNSLSGGMPMDEFELEAATKMLEDAVAESEITKEEGAEVFANVVNCMLIDIIDLASSSLGETGDVTFNAINIVIDFMNHAASLYDAVAENVEIKPVTYGGNLPKSQLEQMYGSYSFSGMMKMEEDMNDRIELLRNVFAISEKKAEGIIMKASQKNMMEMMKTEEGQKQMEEMMGGMMGGMEGMEGMGALAGMMGGGGDGEDMDPAQLKEMLTMLKTMKDSGSIPPDELATVRDQFRESFGSSIDDILKQADDSGGEMSDDDKELLDLMKGILED